MRSRAEYQPDMPAPSQIDPAALERLRRLGGEEFVGKMAELFLSYGAQKISEARQASNAADLAAVAKAAHAIKSSAGNIGASQVQDLATRMERLALEAQAEQVAALMSELEEAFARVEVELKAK
jgi:HPt (histidine-containing phosphotransfer) domain-containing protein